jgi:hypothetical protein
VTLRAETVVRLAERLRDFYASLPQAEQRAFEAFCQGRLADEEVAGFDFSQGRFDPGRHFVGVLLQQGRVQLDADAGEPHLITRRLRRWPAG